MGLLVKDIADHLATAGHGTVGTDLFAGELPPSPDALVAVIDTGGAPPAETFCGIDHENAAVQILARGAVRDGQTVRTKVNAVYKTLAALSGTTIDGTLYVGTTAQQSPFKIEVDGNDRTVMGVNFIVRKGLT